MLANEKHEFSMGRRAAQKGGPASCTTGQASELHINLAYGKGWAEGLPFSAACPALFRNPPDRLFVQPAGPPFCLKCRLPKVHIFHLETALQAARPASPLISIILASYLTVSTIPLQSFGAKYMDVISVLSFQVTIKNVVELFCTE